MGSAASFGFLFTKGAFVKDIFCRLPHEAMIINVAKKIIVLSFDNKLILFISVYF